MAERRERDVDEAGPLPRRRLGREPLRGERPRPVRLDEDIGPAQQAAEDVAVAVAAQSRKAERLPCPVSYSSVPELGRSAALILSTSAPCAASVRAPTGPAMTRVRSRTRTPASGRSPPGSGSGGASPI